MIDLEEFVSGCMQLHGPAKSLQLAQMSHENRVTRQAPGYWKVPEKLQDAYHWSDSVFAPANRKHSQTILGLILIC